VCFRFGGGQARHFIFKIMAGQIQAVVPLLSGGLCANI
jgi:hypothetical protein